jgi:hypothetical protein
MSSQANRPDPLQRAAARSPIAWAGDLNDDCKAQWAGLTLHAEQMDRNLWWWSVTIERTGETLADSHNCGDTLRTGRDARNAAEEAAHRWLDSA